MFTGLSDLYGCMNSQTSSPIRFKDTEHSKHQMSEDNIGHHVSGIVHAGSLEWL